MVEETDSSPRWAASRSGRDAAAGTGCVEVYQPENSNSELATKFDATLHNPSRWRQPSAAASTHLPSAEAALETIAAIESR